MLTLDKDKLLAILSSRKITISELSRTSGISRQGIYNMLKGGSVFNTVFEKIISRLGVDYLEVTADQRSPSYVMKDAPARIRRIAMELAEFARGHGATLVLFGSHTRMGGAKIRADWDFGIFFKGDRADNELVLLKQRLADEAFPYKIDVVNLNRAPDWFIESMRNDAIAIFGSWHPGQGIKRKKAA